MHLNETKYILKLERTQCKHTVALRYTVTLVQWIKKAIISTKD